MRAEWLTGDAVITSEAQLREVVPPPAQVIADKATDHVDAESARFLAQATFCLVASRGPDGSLDLSPRGDPPGQVLVLGDKHLAIADRRGNRRADTLRNLLHHPEIGLLFLVPGVEHALRVNGTARIVRAPELLARFEGEPVLAVVVEVEELFVHCGQALKRSRFWDPASWTGEVPNAVELWRSQTAGRFD